MEIYPKYPYQIKEKGGEQKNSQILAPRGIVYMHFISLYYRQYFFASAALKIKIWSSYRKSEVL